MELVTCHEERAEKPIPPTSDHSALTPLSASASNTQVAKPEEFTVRIEPDGRIILEVEGLEETSYRRILELLEETVGPVRQIEAAGGEPPTRHIHPAAGKTKRRRLDQKK